MTPNPCAGWRWQKLTAPFRQQCEAADLPCWLCNEPIDYRLRGNNRWAFTVDHHPPRWAGGPPLDPTTWRPAHRSCNSARGARETNPLRNRPPEPPRRTELTW